MVAVAWTKLYGFPKDPRLWLAFIVHDLGYVGKDHMDDAFGETHPELGAKIMSIFGQEWHDLALFHSRFYSLKLNKPYSKLCVADKLAYLYYPNRLILFLNRLSGEQADYSEIARKRGLADGDLETIVMWKIENQKWLIQHLSGSEDLLTQQLRKLDERTID